METIHLIDQAKLHLSDALQSLLQASKSLENLEETMEEIKRETE